MTLKKIIVLVGPTAVGKSSLAMQMAGELNAEIVNADSMQIYREMDIGTAKPTQADREQIVHHLIDIVAPDESFNAARYQQAADQVIHKILERDKIPLVVGGTGLYIKALLRGLFQDSSKDANVSAIEKLNHYSCLSEEPHELLKQLDPIAAKQIHKNDTFRSQRALEVKLRTGKSITSFQKQHRFQEKRYNALVVGLSMEREMLFKRIEERVGKMIEQGLLKEVYNLIYKKGYSPDLPSMNSIGYRHMRKVLNKELLLSEAVHMLKRDTRRYAKRQYTWFSNQEKVLWFREDCYCGQKIFEKIQGFCCNE